MDKVIVYMSMRGDLVLECVLILGSDEEDEDLLEEGEEETAENSSTDQPPAALEGDQEEGSKETDAQKSER